VAATSWLSKSGHDIPGRGRQVRQRIAERFDGEPTVIANRTKHFEGGDLGHMTGTWHAAVVLSDVQVADPIACLSYGLSTRLLLTVRVERVEVDATVRLAYSWRNETLRQRVRRYGSKRLTTCPVSVRPAGAYFATWLGPERIRVQPLGSNRPSSCARTRAGAQGDRD
jgi:hypothetical protein